MSKSEKETDFIFASLSENVLLSFLGFTTGPEVQVIRHSDCNWSFECEFHLALFIVCNDGFLVGDWSNFQPEV